MRAVAITDFGAQPHVIELPTPQPGAGELLVRIHAAGVNPFDWKVIDGALKPYVEHSFPLVLGSDGAGVVEQVGPGVSGFRPGDRVFGQFMKVERGIGSYAEYAVTTEGKIARMPDELSFPVAAALPTASAAAYQAIHAANLERGQTILINGGSGGVGQSAIQFAASAGAHVVATVRGDDLAERLRALGAHEVVDFSIAPTSEQVRAAHPDGVDAVLDLVTAGPGPNPMADLLTPGGVLVSTNGAAHPDDLAARGLRGVDFQSRVTPAVLDDLAQLAVSGKLDVGIDAQVDLSDAPAAIAGLSAGHARGKTVILTLLPHVNTSGKS